jgi:hypothetical protein
MKTTLRASMQSLRFLFINPQMRTQNYVEGGESMPVFEYLKTMFSKLTELKPITVAILVVLVTGFIVYLALSKKTVTSVLKPLPSISGCLPEKSRLSLI